MNSASRFPPWLWPGAICCVLLLATFLNYMDRQALPQTATELKERYQLGDARYGMIEACFSYAFAGGSILFGILADRYGPKFLYPIVLIGWSIAGLLTPLAADAKFTGPLSTLEDPNLGVYLWLLGCRTMLGLFESGHWPCALITVHRILSEKNRPLGNSILQSGASLGAIVIPQYVIWIKQNGGGWETVFTSIGYAGLLWVPIWLAFVWRADLKPIPKSEANPSLFRIIAEGDAKFFKQLICTLTIVICISISWQVLRAWLPKYLRESAGYSEEDAANIIMFYYISADIGCLLVGLVVKGLIQRGRTVHGARIWAYFGYSLLIALAALVPLVSPNIAIGFLLVAGAGILGLHPIYYALVQELPSRYVGFMSGIATAFAWIPVGMAQASLGRYIEGHGYNIAFYISGLVPFIGFLSLLFLWRHQPDKPHNP